MKIFNKAKWIWKNNISKKDGYVVFNEKFQSKTKNAILRISCDGIYSVYLNNVLVGFSACSDFPQYKIYDEINLTPFLDTDNNLTINVWHLGEDTQTYINDDAGVIFEVVEDNKVLCFSSADTNSVLDTRYKNGYCKKITSQLGYSFYFDNSVKLNNFSKSVTVNKTVDFNPRGRNQLEMEERLPINIIPQKDSIIIDMKKEVAGFIEIDIESESEQELLISYGEHLIDGGVRRKIASRDFSFEFKTSKGNNKYINTLRRFAGRYLQIYLKSDIKINYVGLRPVIYPIKVKSRSFNEELIQRIYNVSIDTLRLCMHEHYEDCPWREQALYTMDSRNQMLCGYYAFDGYEYQRANLILISKGLRKDGLLSICFPSGTDVPIPSFSLAYIIQVSEYLDYTKDFSILEEIGDTVKTIMATFTDKIDGNGLICSFPYPYWNFYEWAEESNNEYQITRDKDDGNNSYDLILNCLYVYAVGFYNKIFSTNLSVDKIKNSIKNTFYDSVNKVYKLSTNTNKYSQLGNSLAVLIGVDNEELINKILTDKNMITATLSMRTFLYDALLKFGDKYKDYIIDDIKVRYKKMLDSGATSFWETEKGAEDFEGAGSLCHGWSAIPVYYFNLLCK